MTPTFLTRINGWTLQPLSELGGDFVIHKLDTKQTTGHSDMERRREAWNEGTSVCVICTWAASPSEETAEGSSSRTPSRTPRGISDISQRKRNGGRYLAVTGDCYCHSVGGGPSRPRDEMSHVSHVMKLNKLF